MMNIPNLIDDLDNVKFFVSRADYDNSIDIASEGIDQEGNKVRNFIARINAEDAKKLAEVLAVVFTDNLPKPEYMSKVKKVNPLFKERTRESFLKSWKGSIRSCLLKK